MRFLRLTLRELFLMLTCAALACVIAIDRLHSEKLYLHVYGTAVKKDHDPYGPDRNLTNMSRDPWVRIASVEVHTNRPFGFVTPNNRWPYIEIRGIIRRNWDSKYSVQVDFNLDDHNLTYFCDEKRVLGLGEIVYIDQHYDCYLLSNDPDPYAALKSAHNESPALRPLLDTRGPGGEG
jgi:hypothetical protein